LSIRERGKRSFQVRVGPFPAKTFPTRAAAKAYELHLLTRRAQGDLYEEVAQTLGVEIDAWLERHRAMSGARKRTVEFYERSAKVWEPFRESKVSALRRASVEDFIGRRASEHRRSAPQCAAEVTLPGLLHPRNATAKPQSRPFIGALGRNATFS